MANSHGVSRRTDARSNSIKLVNPIADFEVNDFSLEGFGVEKKSEKLFGPNTSFEIAIHLTDRDTMKQLDDCYLTKFTVEVRWSRASNEGFKHGLKIMGLATSKEIYTIF